MGNVKLSLLLKNSFNFTYIIVSRFLSVGLHSFVFTNLVLQRIAYNKTIRNLNKYLKFPR